jgi:hypothetical protein
LCPGSRMRHYKLTKIQLTRLTDQHRFLKRFFSRKGAKPPRKKHTGKVDLRKILYRL